MEQSGAYPLAFGVPSVGERSETFIRMHVNNVLPGKTAVFCEALANPAHWMPDGPTMALYRSPNKWERKFRHGFERMGIRSSGRLKSFLESHAVQAVVCEYLHSFLPYLPDVKAAGARWYSFGHGYDVSALLLEPAWQPRLQALKQADGVICRASSIKERLVSKLGLDPSRVHVVYSSATAPDQPAKHPERDEVKIVAVGRMVPKKGPLIVLQAFQKALQEAPNLRLTYIGEGPLLDEARAFATSNLPQHAVSLPGGRPFEEVLRTMREADVLAQHSLVNPANGDEEGVPNVIIEGMANALPIVSTHHAGIPEVVRHGIDGLIGPEGDVDAMASSFVAMAKEPALRQKMGLSGYERAKNNFTYEHERRAILKAIGMEDLA